MSANRKVVEIPEALNNLLRDTVSPDRNKAEAARQLFAEALVEPLKEAVLSGDIYSDIFSIEKYAPNVKPMYSLDWIVPGTEAEYVAYTVPSQGELPRKFINGDYIEVPTYEIGASLDWNRKFAQVGGANFMGKVNSRLEQMFAKKINDDCFHALLMAGVDRNVVVYDAAAAAGQFTKRLVSVDQLFMRRNAGGNSVTNKRGLTDAYMSLEAFEDIRNWGIDIVDEITRNKIYNTPDGLRDIFGVKLHPLFELGVGQEYQNYFTTDLGGSMASGDNEILIGLDLMVDDSFVMPVVNNLSLEFDDSRRSRVQGMYGFWEFGIGILDSRRISICSI